MVYFFYRFIGPESVASCSEGECLQVSRSRTQLWFGAVILEVTPLPVEHGQEGLQRSLCVELGETIHAPSRRGPFSSVFN